MGPPHGLQAPGGAGQYMPRFPDAREEVVNTVKRQYPDLLTMLLDMGFAEQASADALVSTSGNLELSIALLVSSSS